MPKDKKIKTKDNISKLKKKTVIIVFLIGVLVSAIFCLILKWTIDLKERLKVIEPYQSKLWENMQLKWLMQVLFVGKKMKKKCKVLVN